MRVVQETYAHVSRGDDQDAVQAVGDLYGRRNSLGDLFEGRGERSRGGAVVEARRRPGLADAMIRLGVFLQKRGDQAEAE